MSLDETIEDIIIQSISIIEEEIEIIKSKQDATSGLDRLDTEKVIDYLKTLVVVQRDRRISAKESIIDVKSIPNMTELDKQIAIEAEKERLKALANKA